MYILGSCDASNCLGTVFSSSASFTNTIAGNTYYVVVDADDGSGSAYDLIVNCSIATDVNDFSNEKSNDISLFPNPTTGLVQIKSKDTDLNKLLIINTLGAVMETKNITNNDFVDLSNYPSGMYIFKGSSII